jgi:hypothetical protein
MKLCPGISIRVQANFTVSIAIPIGPVNDATSLVVVADEPLNDMWVEVILPDENTATFIVMRHAVPKDPDVWLLVRGRRPTEPGSLRPDGEATDGCAVNTDVARPGPQYEPRSTARGVARANQGRYAVLPNSIVALITHVPPEGVLECVERHAIPEGDPVGKVRDEDLGAAVPAHYALDETPSAPISTMVEVECVPSQNMLGADVCA